MAAGLLLASLWFVPSRARAEYHNFNSQSGADGIIQEVRWPYWAESTYNAIYSQTISGSDGGSCYFYGGMPSDPAGNPPCSLIWSFWPPSGTSVPGAAVTAYWSASNMYAPPHVGEGASGKVAGDWPLITTNRWYREVFRIWRPTDGTPHLAYSGRWLRDPATSNWFHIATMQIPFSATGIDGLSGFQEDFGHGNINPRRTDYRNVYYHRNGAWTAAKLFTPSVRQLGENGTCGLIENSTAAFFETCSGSSYLFNVTNNIPPTSGNLYMLVATNQTTVSLLTNKPPGITTIAAVNNYAAVGLIIANQPNAPELDPIIVSNATASSYGNQVIVSWQMPLTSSPQLGYALEVFDNPAYSGSPALAVFQRDPEARQQLLNVGAVATPYVRLSIVDIFDRTNAPVLITPAAAALNVATNPPATVSGLGYKYYESATSYYWQYNGVNWSSMPNFGALTPVYQGAVSYPDLTPRRRRNGYAFNYTGFITVPADGIYSFTLQSCAGSKLYVDGGLTINHDGNHSPSPLSGWAALAAGKHAVNVQYFFDTQNSDAGDLTDQLALEYEGPGLAKIEVPSSAWSRVPAAGEPALTLTSPVNGSTIVSSNVALTASVVTNANTINKVQFYVGDSFWGQTNVPPYSLNSFFWSATNNAIRARLFYNTSYTLDSPLSFVTTTNPPLAPWLLAGASEHVQPYGAKIDGGTYTLIGDGLNLLCRPVDGNCTIIARVSGITSTAAAPDGTTPDWSWEAGLIMRESTNSTPGTPLGDSGNSQYSAVFATVNNDTHYQDYTMANAGGPYWSSGLGGQRWLKLQRVGSVFTTSVATDGVNWTPVWTNTLSGIATRLYVGLFTYAAPSQNPNVHWASFDSVSITGSIVGPPGVSVSPQSETAYVGQTATFTALPSGNPPFSYQWQLNGVPLAGATAASLTLTNLQPTNSGLFRVVLSNASGTVTSSVATLNVLTPPPYFSQTLATGPLAYWRLNDAGPIAADAVGTRDGTGQGGIVFGAAGVGAPFAGFEPGNLSAQFNGTDSSVAIPAFNLNTTNFTFSGWVRRNGTQVSWSGIVFCRSGATTAGVHFGTAQELRYTWNDGGNTYNWNSGLTLPDNQWTFFALTIEGPTRHVSPGTNSILRSATNNVTAAQTFPGTTYFGYDPNSSTRRLNGFLDEVALFNRTLTPPEVAALFSASQTALPAVQLTSPATGAVFPRQQELSRSPSPSPPTVTPSAKCNSSTGRSCWAKPPLLLSAPFGAMSPSGQYTLLARVIYDGSSVMSST
ncbi:MAG: LamG-like jellyroll fold domain-containing protein [Verrucomicrobiota bacterium]